MPLYEYRCDACGQRFEVLQKFSDPAPAACAKCGKGPVVRLLSSPAIQFKGTGWYITDYAQKGKSGGESASTSSDGKGSGSGSGDAAKSDTAKETTKSDTARSESTASKPESKPAGTTSKSSGAS